jgi:hypothetical protein
VISVRLSSKAAKEKKGAFYNRVGPKRNGWKLGWYSPSFLFSITSETHDKMSTYDLMIKGDRELGTFN